MLHGAVYVLETLPSIETPIAGGPGGEWVIAIEGGFELAGRPNIGRWIAGCEARLGIEG